MAATTPAVVQPVRIGVLYNPLSGKNRQAPGVLPRIISGYPKVLLKEIRTPHAVHDALVDFARQDINLIVISGGDGTVQAVLTVMFTRQPFVTHPQLVVLEAGTTNMIAGDVGLSGDQHRALQGLFAWALTGRGRVTRAQRPVLCLRVSGHEAKYGMFFGAAIISQGIRYYQQNLHNHGLHGVLGIGLTLFRSLWAAIRHSNRQMTTTAMTVCLDGRPPQRDNFLLFFVTTLNRLFFGLRPFWGDEQGPLRYTAVRTQAPYLLQVLPMLARGRRCRKGTPENGYFSGNVRDIQFFLDSPVALDGELYTPDSIQEPTVLQCGGSATFLRVE
ncbi:MAG: diacylglycerol kinase family protein [Desulforhopalus sp.]|nr:diacylglycerol kinase family protein [Desulforhopalus sp.]